MWLDDVRPAPEGWTQVRSVNEATRLMTSMPISDASLDHDLGEFAADGGDGWRLVDWMAETDTWPTNSVTVHSSNPVGAQRMLDTVDRYGGYRRGFPGSRTRTV